MEPLPQSVPVAPAMPPREMSRPMTAQSAACVIDYAGVVTDHDGYMFDLLNPNMDLDVIFGGEDDPSWSWCGDFLSARMRMPKTSCR